jgi:hypothetical protein
VTAIGRDRRIWIAEEVAECVFAAATAAHPTETGGVLIGVETTRRRPWITDAVELPSPKATGSFYEVPSGGRRQAVAKLRRRDPRLGYLGEWHVHPGDVPPSPTDASTLVRLAGDSEAGCEQPVLLVARRMVSGYRLDARQLRHGRLRELQIIASGRLLPLGTAPCTPRALLRFYRELR